MRSKEEMLSLILSVAEKDPRVRAVAMNGSRVEPNATQDIFQDFDILYFVTEMESFFQDPTWIDVFGELMVMQLPDVIDNLVSPDNHFAYLMQFQDGNRIDLSLIPLHQAHVLGGNYGRGIILLDKDGGAERYLTADPNEFIIKKPTKKDYDGACSEFWWVTPYVAKGIWRRQLPYAMHMYYIAHAMLEHMTRWHIGKKKNYGVTTGNAAKYFEKYLSAEEWTRYQKTYPAGAYDSIWTALFVMCDLFRDFAIPLAEEAGSTYPFVYDENVMAHLRYVKTLPQDATELYPARK